MLNRRALGYGKWNRLLIVATVLTLSTGCDDTVEPVPEPDPVRSALVALYESTSGDRWALRHNWLTDAPNRSWSGGDADRR